MHHSFVTTCSTAGWLLVASKWLLNIQRLSVYVVLSKLKCKQITFALFTNENVTFVLLWNVAQCQCVPLVTTDINATTWVRDLSVVLYAGTIWTQFRWNTISNPCFVFFILEFVHRYFVLQRPWQRPRIKPNDWCDGKNFHCNNNAALEKIKWNKNSMEWPFHDKKWNVKKYLQPILLNWNVIPEVKALSLSHISTM